MEPTRRNVLAWAARKPGISRTKTYPCTECVLGQFFKENSGAIDRMQVVGKGTTTVYISSNCRVYDVNDHDDIVPRVRVPALAREYSLALSAIMDTGSSPTWGDVCFTLRESLAREPEVSHG